MKRNKSLIKLISLISFLTLISSNVFAQVTVKLQQPPPYQFKVEQFWKIILINNGKSPVNIYLKGTASSTSQGRIIEATSSVISLLPGIRTVNGRDLGPFSVSESDSRYKNIILNTGSIPSGSYDICVAVFRSPDGEELGSDCIQTNVENLNRMELISPADLEVVGGLPAEDAETPKSKNTGVPTPVIFSWLPPVPVPPEARISYRLKLVEILGFQSVHSAMASNPLYYQSPIISATMLRYPVAARQLAPGGRYAWSVECFIDDYKIQESEIRSFIIPGGEEKEEKYSANTNDDTKQYGENYIYDIIGLPSGLSSVAINNYRTSEFSIPGSPAPIDQSGSPGIIKFSGDAKFTEITSSKPAQFSQLPSNYQTFAFNPKLSIYNIPFGLNVYLSSLNSSSRQSVNSVSFILDLEALKSKIRDRISAKTREIQSTADSYLAKVKDLTALADPSKIKDQISEKTKEIQSSADSSLGKLKDISAQANPDKLKDALAEKIKSAQASADSSLGKLKEIQALKDPAKLAENADQLGLISSAEKFVLDIKTLGIGRTYPDYSEFTVSGVPVNGLNLAYNPGIFYFAFTAGNNLEGIDDVSFKRSFLAGRFGLGEKESSHFILSAVKMKDDPNSIQVSSTNQSLTPEENFVFDSDGRLDLLKKMIEIDGEGAVSGFTRNLTDADFTGASIPGFINNFLTPKLSTSFDYSWKGRLVFNYEPSATNLSVGIKRIGPGFISLAAPNLKQDQFQFDFGFDQKFADRKITLKTFFKIYNDNLINWKQTTTSTSSFGINLGLNFPNLPFLQINYSPYSQSNDAADAAQMMENKFDLFSLMTGYSYRFSGVYATTMFSFNGQWQKSMIGNFTNEFLNRSYMITQSLNFEFPLTLSSTLSMTQSQILSVTSNITEFNLNGNYQFSGMISANAGATISNEENATKRTMIFLGSNIILAEWLRFELQGNLSNYKDLSGGINNYNDSMLQASVSVKW